MTATTPPPTPTPTAPTSSRPRPRLDRHLSLALLLALLILLPRNLLITRAHSPTQDEQTHLRAGLSRLTGNPSGLVENSRNTAPLGQVAVALPLYFAGCRPDAPMNPATLSPRPLASEDPHSVTGHATPELMRRLRAARHDILFGHALPPDTLRLLVSAWNALLFLPAVGLIFHWTRWLYGLPPAWLAFSLVLIDPTLAAALPLATPDTVAVTGILFACYFAWRALERPDRRLRLVTASFLAALALLLKLTSLILPAVIAMMAAAFWFRTDRLTPTPASVTLRRRLNYLLSGALLTALFLWALLGFSLYTPGEELPYPPKHTAYSFYADALYPALQHRWPAGDFVRVLIGGLHDSAQGRFGFLLGRARPGGWWYYFPVLAAYKVPLGYFAVFAAAIVSLARRATRPRFDELSLALPLLGWTAMLLLSHINTGFRHFLPAYVFLLMLSARALLAAPALLRYALFSAVGLSFAHTLTYHPDYIAYFNHPVEKPWQIANDSNIDWGQSLKEIRAWLDAHPTDRPVYLRYDWDDVWIDYYLGDRVRRLKLFQTPPTTGLLIISPVWEAGYWDPGDGYAFLRPHPPIAVIGHAIPVYDLDAINSAAPATGMVGSADHVPIPATTTTPTK